ncbi:30S ribosomal protein S4 [Methanosarcinales archaeon ex4572_44]|nr:MAG: 30S ribosomal protein S4 [Methanosarcinales archaeon ex4484_138]PHP45486.1 MAG: 30S ribosomal protein S4 [Methanosarcinales archaeon ex4572_44]RLG25173.1 MAG: 30S ribosomal protein S4 [Methanosarcinales archaeon]
MGYPGKNRKSYETPKHPWEASRMAGEVDLMKTYGLRNKREVWKAHSMLKKYRQTAMRLLAETAKGEISDHVKGEADSMLKRLKKYVMLKEDGTLDDVMALEMTTILDRRLQSQVHKQGFARTKKQARQFIVHGHIAVGGRKIDVPGYMLTKEEEIQIDYYTQSPINKENHLERPERVLQALTMTPSEEEV